MRVLITVSHYELGFMGLSTGRRVVFPFNLPSPCYESLSFLLTQFTDEDTESCWDDQHSHEVAELGVPVQAEAEPIPTWDLVYLVQDKSLVFLSTKHLRQALGT